MVDPRRDIPIAIARAGGDRGVLRQTARVHELGVIASLPSPPSPFVFHAGSLAPRWYGVLIAAGIFVGLIGFPPGWPAPKLKDLLPMLARSAPVSGEPETLAEALRAYAREGIAHVQLVLDPITIGSIRAVAPALAILARA